jgi:hypothetical protein
VYGCAAVGLSATNLDVQTIRRAARLTEATVAEIRQAAGMTETQ